MVGIECNGAAFITSFQEGPQLFFQNSASKMANSIIIFYVITGKLSNSFLFFVPFTKIWS